MDNNDDPILGSFACLTRRGVCDSAAALGLGSFSSQRFLGYFFFSREVFFGHHS